MLRVKMQTTRGSNFSEMKLLSIVIGQIQICSFNESINKLFTIVLISALIAALSVSEPFLP